jgi:hypothetical protein
MGNSSSSSRSSEEEQEIKVPPQTQTVQSPPAPTQSVPTQGSAPSDSANVVESQVVDTYKRPPRLTAWFGLLAASVIVLTSSIRFVIETRSALWILVVSIISIVFSILAIIGHNFLKHKFVGKVWGEGILSYLLFLCWIGGLAVCMSPTRALAVARTQFGQNVVINANLYFSSWFAFICIFYVVASWTMTYWKKAAEVISAITGRLAKWWCILIVSIIVLVSSAQFHVSQDCHNEGSTDLGNQACKSNKYAITLGACGSVLTIVVIVLAHFGKIRFLVESISTVVMFLFYTAGIAIITYNNGPGVTIGNLVSHCCMNESCVAAAGTQSSH